MAFQLKIYDAPEGGSVLEDADKCTVKIAGDFDSVTQTHHADRTELEGYVLAKCTSCGNNIGNQTFVVDRPYPGQVIYVERTDNRGTCLTVKFQPSKS